VEPAIPREGWLAPIFPGSGRVWPDEKYAWNNGEN
jgi:hypothetical protein